MAGAPKAVTKVFNPLALRLAGHRWLPVWAVLRHRGRRSGREYATPVAVLVTPDTFVIALPWGTGTDWVRNVLAAGECTITWRSLPWRCTEPTLVDRDVALAAANRFERAVIARAPFRGFLQIRRWGEVNPTETQGPRADGGTP